MTEVKISTPVVPRETNDCTVRAFAAALDTDYGKAHRLCRESGRKNRRGHWTQAIAKYVNTAWKAGIREVKLAPRPTLREFITAHPKGRYVVTVRGHALAVINGVASDKTRQSRPLVQAHRVPALRM